MSVPPAMRAIIDEVAKSHGLTFESIRARTSKRLISWPRQEAMYRLYEMRRPTGERRWSTTQVGRALGGFDHTTVIYSIQRHASRAEANHGS